MNPYAYWQAALAGEKPKCFVDSPECGFFRKGVYEKQDGKARKRVGWSPVAIFLNGAELVAVIGGNTETDRDKINELWSYVASYPISEETYRAVAERGAGWPDDHETDAPPKHPTPEGATGTSPENVLADQLDECTKQIIKYAKIESDEQSAKARSLQNRFLDLRSEAAKHYETANRPLLEQQKKLRETWFPLRDLADAGSVAMRTAMGTWEDTKRQAAKLAAEAAEKATREHAAAALKAKENNQPPPPPMVSAKSNVPPPASQIRGGPGRAASVSVAVFVTMIDEDAVFKQFKGNPELTAMLTALAQKAIRAGIPVPGATTEERSVVR